MYISAPNACTFARLPVHQLCCDSQGRIRDCPHRSFLRSSAWSAQRVKGVIGIRGCERYGGTKRYIPTCVIGSAAPIPMICTAISFHPIARLANVRTSPICFSTARRRTSMSVESVFILEIYPSAVYLAGVGRGISYLLYLFR